MQNTPSFYWHDYETFGIGRAEAFPAQFAGRRTDLDLNPLGEGEIIYCRPNRDTLPSPESCILTGILPQFCEEHGLHEAQFAEEVFRRLAQPGTIGIGYNTMSFDDEVTRFLMWRNFRPPYDREFANGCGHWDLYPLVLALWALRPEGIVWPRWRECEAALSAKRLLPLEPRDPESLCFKLECLTEANGISHEKAHDALSDVEGTIGLARLIREKKPAFWRWAFEHRDKRHVVEALDAGPVVWCDPSIGIARGYVRCVAQIGALGNNPNAALVWDLMEDPEELFSLSPEEIRARSFKREAELPEGKSRLPIRKLIVNKCPFVCGALGVLRGRAEFHGIDLERVKANWEKFTPERIQAVRALTATAFSRELWQEEHAKDARPDADAALYDAGFPSVHDKQAVRWVRSFSPEKLAAAVDAGKIFFENPVYEELLLRYRGRNAPQWLNDAERARWNEFVGLKMASALPEYKAKLDDLEAKLEGRGADLIRALRAWPERASL